MLQKRLEINKVITKISENTQITPLMALVIAAAAAAATTVVVSLVSSVAAALTICCTHLSCVVGFFLPIFFVYD